MDGESLAVISIALKIGVAIWAYHIAKGRNRPEWKIWAAVLSFFFGLWGLIGIALLLKDKKLNTPTQ